MRKLALGGRDRRHDEHRVTGDARRSGGHSRWGRDGGDSVRLLRQDDPVSMVVRGGKFDDVSFRHPVAVGRKAGAQRSEDQEQEAGQQPFG
ncbi:MAG: hypothetical protein IH968_19575 [Gemmatimonadetes bacterium]|nr:hypothetical protein [Gemmatimonadota bacterium]